METDALGEVPEALSWLEKTYEERSERMPFLGVDVRLSPLASEPRFRALAARLAYPRLR